MNGVIKFENVETLAAFLKEFVGTTAVFEVKEVVGGFVLTFTGGF